MARPLRVEYPGAFYHITSRGNEGRDVYESDRDREKFLFYLESAHERFKIIVHAYCLMTSHYHLILETPQANLSRCMQFLNSGYTSYFNIKRKRKGHLFQGRYKAFLVDKDSYMQRLSRYTHLNPVKAKIVDRPEEYKWSSYIHFVGKTRAPKYLDVGYTLGFFDGDRQRYKAFVEAGITGEVENVFKEVNAGFILGERDFVEKIKEKYLGEIERTEDLPELRKLGKRYISYEELQKILKQEYGDNDQKINRLAAYYLRKYTDHTLQEIIKTIHNKKMSSSAISKIVSRVDRKRKTDKEFDRELAGLEGKMSMSRSDSGVPLLWT